MRAFVVRAIIVVLSLAGGLCFPEHWVWSIIFWVIATLIFWIKLPEVIIKRKKQEMIKTEKEALGLGLHFTFSR